MRVVNYNSGGFFSARSESDTAKLIVYWIDISIVPDISAGSGE